MKITSLIALIVLLTACSTEPTVEVLRVCLGENDPPRSEASPVRGFDVDVARLIAQGLDHEFRPVWLAAPNPTEIESTDIDYGPLLAGRCDIQLSVPGAGALGSFAQNLALTQPYYGAGFELVPATATIDLNFPGNDRIAVRSNTVAHVLVDQLGFPWTMHHDSADIVNTLKRGEAEAGLIWGPEIAMTQTSYNLQFEAPSALRWNHHAVTRVADVALREAIDGILASADVQEEIEDSMRRHGIPPRRPFVTVHRLEMIAQ